MPESTKAQPTDWTSKAFAALAAVAVAVAAAYSEQVPELCLTVGPLFSMFSSGEV